MKPFKKILSLVFLILVCLSVFTQDGDIKKKQTQLKQLEEKEKKAEEKIEKNKIILERVTKEAIGLKQKSRILDQNIRERKYLINIYEEQVDQLDKDISRKQKIIAALEKDLEQIKEEYKSLVIDAYRHQNGHNRLLFVFKANTFNDLINRLRYIERYTDYRKKQADLIIQTRSHINFKVLQLNDTRNKKIQKLNELDSERKNLDKDKEQISVWYNESVKEKQKIKSEIEKIRKEKAALNKEITSTIQEIIRLEKLKNETDFDKFKGSLAWPVPKNTSTIVGEFGRHKHPIYDVWLENSGIDIATKKETEVSTVFKGKVIQTMISPAFQKAIIISHGSYFTVYSNLKEVYVAKGDELKGNERIGKVFTNKDNETELHFEVWDGDQTVDPEKWLMK